MHSSHDNAMQGKTVFYLFTVHNDSEFSGLKQATSLEAAIGIQGATAVAISWRIQHAKMSNVVSTFIKLWKIKQQTVFETQANFNDTSLKVCNLWSFWCSSIDTCVSYSARFVKQCNDLGHLLCKFSCRH